MKKMPLEIGTIHFVGIGGIGMSGIAEVLHNLGYKVQGSDLSENANVERLKAQGVRVVLGHSKENVYDEDGMPSSVVVISSAVKDDNVELQTARELRLPVVRRAEMLAELMRLKWSVAVAGTHGKTTTTSLVGTILEAAGYDPTVINGGIINSYGTNTRMGQSDWMVVEADESDGTFTRLPATAAVVTNIDPEHLDFYGKFDHVKLAFQRFVENLPFYGFAALCTDHPVVQALVPKLRDKRIVTYGFNAQADIRAMNIETAPDGTRFDVRVKEWLSGDDNATSNRHEAERMIEGVTLPMLGDHNVQNALAAIAVAVEMGVEDALIRKGLAQFSGVKRRFTTTGVVNGVRIIDDYAHHPVEINAVLKAARQGVSATGGKVIAVMQPHRYTRLQSLFEDFCHCFNDADLVYIADVYEAGETPIEGADKPSLVKALQTHGHNGAHMLESREALAPLIADIAEDGDFVVCMGAGSISKWAGDLPQELKALKASAKKA